MKSINKEIPSAGAIAIKNVKNELKSSLIANCIPLVILNFISGYLFLPLSIKVIRNSTFKLWNFDFLPTAFIFIAIWIWILLIWNMYISIRLFLKIYRCKIK